jgi:hypothetical protein
MRITWAAYVLIAAALLSGCIGFVGGRGYGGGGGRGFYHHHDWR